MAKAEDLMQYGFESEFVGRLPVVSVFEELSVDDLYEILKNPRNPVINAKKADFRAYGIDIRFEDEALRLLAEQAHQERTGARGLVSVLEKAVLPFEKKLPSTDIRFLVVTAEVVQNPAKTLKHSLDQPDDPKIWQSYQQVFGQDMARAKQAVLDKESDYRRKYGKAFSETRIDLIVTWHLRSGANVEDLFKDVASMIHEVRDFEAYMFDMKQLRVRFTEEAVDEILHKAVTEEISAEEVCKKVSTDYDYALKLVTDKTGQQEFLIPKEAIQDPDGFINDLIRKSYGTGPFAVSGPRDK
jgi:ATP-dependent protease Clp ATPase subunit